MEISGAEVMIVLILVGASIIRGALGFGDALLAMPLLAFLLPMRSASPLMALAAILISIVIIAREWRELDFRSAALLICFGLIGIPLGIWMLRSVDDRIVKSLLGLLVMGFSIWSLWKPSSGTLRHDRYAPIFGIAAGILGGAYNTSGPPLVLYAALRSWPPPKFRAMMQAYCLFSSSWIITLHATSGNITDQTLKLLGVGAPFMILGTLAGQWSTRGVATERFIRWVYFTLIIIGLWLILSSTIVKQSMAGTAQPAAIPWISDTLSEPAIHFANGRVSRADNDGSRLSHSGDTGFQK